MRPLILALGLVLAAGEANAQTTRYFDEQGRLTARAEQHGATTRFYDALLRRARANHRTRGDPQRHDAALRQRRPAAGALRNACRRPSRSAAATPFGNPLAEDAGDVELSQFMWLRSNAPFIISRMLRDTTWSPSPAGPIGSGVECMALRADTM